MCLLKRGPQSLPVNHMFMGVTLLINLILSAALNRNARLLATELAQPETSTQINFVNEFGMVIVATIVFAILVFVWLRVFNYQARIYQTLFALFGTGVIFAGLMLIVTAISSSSPFLWALTFISIGIWSLVVSGNILATALDTTLFRGVLVVIGIGIVQAVVGLSLFDAPTSIAVPSPTSAT
ncbi:MAG: hypothetical protein OXG05_06075 [Gammaproteobacteria bacterium]|nr:hypothetical protein [Gammaproteobacteria bacterium]